jgi:hypothetical protein
MNAAATLAPGNSRGVIWNANMLAEKKDMQTMFRSSASKGDIALTRPDFVLT